MIRVLLVDDQLLVRAGIRMLVRGMSNVEIVAEAGNGAEALEKAAQHRPDVVLMDISMPVMNGLQATSELKRSFPDINVIILSMHEDEACIEQALRSGACGYLLKEFEASELAHAIETAARGAIHLGPHVSKLLVTNYLSRPGEGHKETPATSAPEDIPLTARQREILKCVAEGMTGKAIAQRLGISPKTVEGHRSQLMQRLLIHDVPGLVRYAIRTGLVAADR